MEEQTARPVSDPTVSGDIPSISDNLAFDRDFAQKFPLDGSVEFLDLDPESIDILKALGITLVRDLFRKRYTYRQLNDDAPITIADNVNEALIKKELPPLSGTDTDGILYAFYDKERRSALTIIEASVISDLMYGPKSREEIADEYDIPEILVTRKLNSAVKKLQS